MSRTYYSNDYAVDRPTAPLLVGGVLKGLDMLKMILLYLAGILIVLLIVFFGIGFISAKAISSQITTLEERVSKAGAQT